MITARRARITKAAAGLMTLGLLAAACGGGGGSGKGGNKTATTQGQKLAADEGKPVIGGRLVWGLPAETSGGYCQPEAQLAISGIQVNRAIYDTLTVPDENDNYVPYLAESVTPNTDFTVWTIKLRSGIKFHDGTDLTAQVVKDNLDAYRGEFKDGAGNKIRNPQLFLFVFPLVKAIKVVDPLTVQVDMKGPWSSFPATLYASGRLGMAAEAQLRDPKNCASNMIGTGPFKLKQWKKNDQLTVVRNPNYWRKDAAGNQLPYLDEIEFRPVVESQQVVNGVQSGNLSIVLDDVARNIVKYRQFKDAGQIKLAESDKFPELQYTMLNATRAPFNDINARLAFAYAVDRDQLNKIRYGGILTPASGPFGPGTLGFLPDTGLPSYDPAKAKQYVQQYEQATGKKLSLTYVSAGTDPEGLATIDFIKGYLQKAGMQVKVQALDESAGINAAIGKQFDAIGWRNHPGYDPDTEYVWWHCNTKPPAPCDNLVNFGGFNDAVINKAFDDARATNDRAKRQALFESINREFAKQLYNAWGFYSIWAIPHQKNVNGVGTLALPNGAKPFPGFTSGVDPAGVWVK